MDLGMKCNNYCQDLSDNLKWCVTASYNAQVSFMELQNKKKLHIKDARVAPLTELNSQSAPSLGACAIFRHPPNLHLVCSISPASAELEAEKRGR